MPHKGYKRTEESKLKQSLAIKGHLGYFKGKKHSAEAKKKMLVNLIGRKVSEITKQKISSSLLGKKHTQQRKINNSLGHLSLKLYGEKASNWKGGKTLIGQNIRMSKKYIDLRNFILKRDNYSCLFPGCLDKTKKLHTHHIKPFAKHPELRFDKNNLITLCKDCHKNIHWKEIEYENLFLIILNKLYA